MLELLTRVTYFYFDPLEFSADTGLHRRGSEGRDHHRGPSLPGTLTPSRHLHPPIHRNLTLHKAGANAEGVCQFLPGP